MTCDNEGGLKFWHFGTLSQLDRVSLGRPIVRAEMNRTSGLMATAHADFSLNVVDVVTRKVVREFAGHDNQVTDIAMSADSRWLVSASLDNTVKVWDIPTGKSVFSTALIFLLNDIHMSLFSKVT